MRFLLLFFAAITAVSLQALGAEAVSGAERAPGKFVWVELLTSGEPARSALFYEKVFGWRPEVTGKGYSAQVRFFQGKQAVAGISYRTAERMESTRARWLLFFATADLTNAVKRVTKKGGKVLMPVGVSAELVEQAVLADPEGASFGLLAATEGNPEDYAAEPGEWIWPLLLAHRPDESARFYADVLQLEINPEPRTPLFSGDFVLADGPRARAALMALPRSTAGRPGWLGLIRVKNLDETVAAVEKYDGLVLREPGDDLIGGRVAVVADPEGAVFGLVELAAAMGPDAPDRNLSRRVKP